MTGETLLPFSFPAVAHKKVTASFHGGHIGPDGGVMLLAMADWRLGLAERLARCFPNHRDPLRITHILADMINGWVLAIACSYEDASILKRNYRPMARLLRNVAWGEISSTTQQRKETSSKPIRRAPALA